MPDVNVLVYAHRADELAHAFYRDWVDRLATGPQPFALSALVAVAFVRVVTHARFRNAPTPREDAFAVVEALRRRPNCRFVGLGEGHWPLVRDLCRAAALGGAMVSDAQHAAVAMEHGCTLVSRDTDFERFEPHGLSFQLLEPP